jgi:hypothetical protein
MQCQLEWLLDPSMNVDTVLGLVEFFDWAVISTVDEFPGGTLKSHERIGGGFSVEWFHASDNKVRRMWGFGAVVHDLISRL